jgi:hypothetical protein
VKILKAKIKPTSTYYKKGLNHKGKSEWLSITGFSPRGEKNFRIKAIKGIKDGFTEFEEIWIGIEEIILKKIVDNQLSLDILSPQEEKENRYNPRFFNQRRFEVLTKNDKLYFHAPNIETVKKIMKQYGISEFSIKQVKRLTKKELDE